MSGSASSSSYDPYALPIPSAPAAAWARARSRDAIATTGVSRPACIAGIIFFTAKCETPSTPKRNMAAIVSDHRAVPDDAVLGDDDDALANEVAVAVRLFDPAFIDDAHAAPDARVLVDDGVLDHRFGADAHRRHAARLGRAHLVQRLVVVGADEQAVLDLDARPDAAA